MCAPKEYEWDVVPVKIRWGYLGCGRSPVSESGRISAAAEGEVLEKHDRGEQLFCIIK